MVVDRKPGWFFVLQLRLTVNGDPGRVGALNEWMVGIPDKDPGKG
jgi:hypothetical protein